MSCYGGRRNIMYLEHFCMGRRNAHNISVENLASFPMAPSEARVGLMFEVLHVLTLSSHQKVQDQLGIHEIVGGY